jgi:hypothetical protein
MSHTPHLCLNARIARKRANRTRAIESGVLQVNRAIARTPGIYGGRNVSEVVVVSRVAGSFPDRRYFTRWSTPQSGTGISSQVMSSVCKSMRGIL